MRIGKRTQFQAVTALVGFLVGCHRPAVSPAVDAGAASVARPTPGVTASASVKLDAKKVEAFVALQRKEIELTSAALKMVPRLPDGGFDLEKPEGKAAIQTKEAGEDAARKASGLSLAEIRLLNEISAEVIAKRLVAKDFDMAPQIGKLEALRDKLPDDQRASVDATIAKLRGEQESLSGLKEERARYGDDNVNLVLQQESALSENYRKGQAAF